MSAHTPGPWAVADLSHSIVVRTQSFKKSKFGADRYAAIGGFDRSDPEQLAEAMANARLIAAAPELLEFAELVLRGINSGAVRSQPVIEYEESAEQLDMRPLSEIARAAITKATGGAT